jgi:hypothetical protein
MSVTEPTPHYQKCIVPFGEGEHLINKRASDVVVGFEQLTPEEQTQAYLEIETIWKAPQKDKACSDTNTSPLRD